MSRGWHGGRVTQPHEGADELGVTDKTVAKVRNGLALIIVISLVAVPVG